MAPTPPARRALVAALFALFALGCSASLRDGLYGCADGHCPTGYVCHSDGLCYTRAEDAAMPVDSGMPPPDGGLPPRDGGGPTCSPMCAPPQQCVIGQYVPMSMPTYGCASSASPNNHGNRCTMGDATCAMPDVCLPGPTSACMRPCNPVSTTNDCGFGETCTSVGTTHVCAAPCPGPCPGSTTCNTTLSRCLPPGW